MNRIGLSHPLPCLAVFTLACLNTTYLHAEDTQSSKTLSSTSSSIIQVDEQMLPALFGPMTYLLATHPIESDTAQDNSLETPRAAVVRAVITQHRATPANQLNTEDNTPARKIELPRARDFTPVTSTTISRHATVSPMSVAMIGR